MNERRREFLSGLAGVALSAAIAREVFAKTPGPSFLNGPAPELLSGEDLVYASVATQLRWLRAKKITSEQLLLSYLDRIEKIDHKLAMKTFITVDRNGALARAKELDLLANKGEFAGPLHGLPIAIKDDICTKDMPTTAGSKALQSWHPQNDAFVIQSLRHAGAVIVGKTNLNEFTVGPTGRNLHFGQVLNPHDLNRMPGGSSAGSAAATASAFCAAALGSDSSGSIRGPAGACGVVGYRPTRGTVSKTGLIPNSPTKEVIGVIARSVEDAAIITSVLVNHDPTDVLMHKSSEWKWPNFSRKDLKNLRFAHLIDYKKRADKDVRTSTEKAIGQIRALGGEVTEILSPEFEILCDVADTIHFVEIRTWVPLALEKAGLSFETSSQEIDPALVRAMNQFAQIPSSKYCRHLQWTRQKLIDTYLALFKKYDFLVLPTCSMVSPPIEKAPPSSEDDGRKRRELYKALRENGEIAGVTGLPAISIPSGFSDGGLPTGLQLIGNLFDDCRLFETANTLAAKIDSYRRPKFKTKPS